MSEPINWSALSTEQRDALIAERVMDWAPQECDGEISWDHGIWRCLECGIDGTRHETTVRTIPVPHYTTSHAASMLVVERITQPPQSREEALQAANTQFMLWWKQAELWSCSTEEAANEICLAALRAVGVQVEYEAQS